MEDRILIIGSGNIGSELPLKSMTKERNAVIVSAKEFKDQVQDPFEPESFKITKSPVINSLSFVPNNRRERRKKLRKIRNMEDKTKEFIEQSSFQPFQRVKGLLWYTSEDKTHSINLEVLIEEAIQFGEKRGSHLTAERAKEKVFKLENYKNGTNEEKYILLRKIEVLQAIEESKL